jgi:oxygen-dependent protoporphyrinogen oxidase
MSRVAVVGGGIAGLVTAYHLERGGLDVVVLESSERLGGKIGSVRDGDWLAELGPHALMGDEAFASLVADLGLEDQRVWASAEAKKRFIVRDGAPMALPMGPRDLLATDILTTAEKFRILREPAVRSKTPSDRDESVADFVRRRFGVGVLDYLVDPFVSGVWAGDASKLSARWAFPKLVEWERGSGSVILGALRGVSSGGPRGPKRLFSFEEGVATLPERLGTLLSDVRTSRAVVRIESRGRGWVVHHKRPGARGRAALERVDAVLLTAPLPSLQNIELLTDSGGAWPDGNALEYPPVTVVTRGYKRGDVEHPLDGFGMLVPSCENRRVLGVLFPSTLFPRRAPSGHVTLASFIGGARHPDYARLPAPELHRLLDDELGELLGVRGEPVFELASQVETAIPQFGVGHGRVRVDFQAFEKRHPRIYLGGNYVDGIAVPSLVDAATAKADRIRNALAVSSSSF